MITLEEVVFGAVKQTAVFIIWLTSHINGVDKITETSHSTINCKLKQQKHKNRQYHFRSKDLATKHYGANPSPHDVLATSRCRYRPAVISTDVCFSWNNSFCVLLNSKAQCFQKPKKILLPSNKHLQTKVYTYTSNLNSNKLNFGHGMSWTKWHKSHCVWKGL